tara:strand:+ start:137388 stop:138140 length:753 start_codon:yes stop_codon:yes gene_type:complete
MNFHINQRFKTLKNSLLETILNFNSFDAGFGTGKRNSVKKIDLASKTIIVKSFKTPNLFNQIVYKYIRKSKAKRSFEYATKLAELGIESPTPIAYIEYFSILGLQKSFYISEFLDYDLTYRELVHQPAYPNHETILRAFTRFTYELHEKGVLFLDHSPGNTLIVNKSNNYHFYLVDLNRMQFGNVDFEQRMKNFSRLTPKKQMVEIMSDEYAKLTNESFEKVFDKMWFYTEQFRTKFARKKQLKKKYLGK